MSGPEYLIGSVADPDRYKIGEPVGAGSEGILYRGSIDVGAITSLDVAIKMLHPNHRARLEQWNERWASQIELLRSLQAPGVVPVRDGFAGPLPHLPGQANLEALTLYLVMNWIEGEPLDSWSDNNLTISPEDRLKLLLPVVGALDLMHSGRATGGTPVIHGDVKPSNILVRPTGETVLVDFGLVRLLPEGRHSTGVTGTPGYVSPEIRENGVYTAAADRYALGGVAFFLLTGTEPDFSGTNGDARSALAGRYPDRPDLIEHVMQMLDRDPDARPNVLANWCAQLRNSSLDIMYEPDRLPPISIPVTPLTTLEGSDKITVSLAGDDVGLKKSSQRITPSSTVVKPEPETESNPGWRNSKRTLVASLGVAVALIAASAGFLALHSGASTADSSSYSFAPAVLSSGLIVARNWTESGSPPVLSESLDLTNGTSHVLSTSFDEVIPSTVAKSVNDVSFSPPPSQILQSDPVVRYDLSNMAPGTSREFHYSVTLSGSMRTSLRALSESQLSASGGFQSASEEAVESTLSISPPSVTIRTGGSRILVLSGRMSNGQIALPVMLKPVQWSSTDPVVATVASGKVIALAPGITAISARLGQLIAVASVRVVPRSSGSPVTNQVSGNQNQNQGGGFSSASGNSTGSPGTSSPLPSSVAPPTPSPSIPVTAPTSTLPTSAASAPSTPSQTATPSNPAPTTPTTTASTPTTYAETVGGVSHTWTDYADAGGTEGPSIPSNETVQITCKVTGFAVADGNTWWYQIASPPWNNSYYVSADAFYNNGATSGSLVGTPFVDPSVPDC